MLIAIVKLNSAIKVRMTAHHVALEKYKEVLATFSFEYFCGLLTKNHETARRMFMENFYIKTNDYSTKGITNPLNSKFEKYAIDTSIAGNDDIIKNISDLCVRGKKIYITTTTVDELTKLVNNRDIDTAATARKLLRLSSITYPESFQIIDTSEYSGVNNHINQVLGICDSRILQFCYENKDEIMLLTADRAMSLYARSLQISVMCLETRTTFLKSKGVYLMNRPKAIQLENNPDYPAMHVARQDGGLIIHNPQNYGAGIEIRVINPSINREFNYGPIYIYSGYLILIARIDQRNDIHFSVYRVTSMEGPKGKYELVFSKFYRSYYTYFNVDGNRQYEQFLCEFKKKYTRRLTAD